MTALLRKPQTEVPDIRYLVGQPRGSSPIKVLCPFHDDETPSYAIYSDGGYCFACGAKESAAQVIARLQADPAELPRVLVSRDLRRKPGAVDDPLSEASRQRELATAIHHRTLTQGSRKSRLQYLYQRGIYPDAVEQFRLGHTGDRFFLPVLESGRVTGYQLRADPEYCYSDELRYITPRGQAPCVFRPLPTGSPSVIAEGQLDSILLCQFGIDATTCAGGAATLAEVLAEVPLRKPLIMTDMDPAGDKAAADLLALFKGSRRITWEGGGDIGEALCQVDPAYRGSWLRQLLEGG